MRRPMLALLLLALLCHAAAAVDNTCGIERCDTCASNPPECTECDAGHVLTTDHKCAECAIADCAVCEVTASGGDRLCEVCDASYVRSLDKKSCLSCNIADCALCADPSADAAAVTCELCSDTLAGLTQVPSSDGSACLPCDISNCTACASPSSPGDPVTCTACMNTVDANVPQIPNTDGSACLECDIAFCQECEALNETDVQCKVCSDGNGKNADGDCVGCDDIECDTCENVDMVDGSSNSLEMCTVCSAGHAVTATGTCVDCDIQYCDKCVEPSDHADQVCEKCRDISYLSVDSKSCVACGVTGCLECNEKTSPQTCKTCSPGRQKSADGQTCVDCSLVHAQCVACDGSTCSGCADGYTLSADKTECIVCPLHCADGACEVDASGDATCSKCRPFYTTRDTASTDDCTSCDGAVTGCVACTKKNSQVTCTKCIPGHSLTSNTCTKNSCDDTECLLCGEDGTTCLLCDYDLGYHMEDGSCKQCSASLSDCSLCDPAAPTCAECEEGHVPFGDQCLAICYECGEEDHDCAEPIEPENMESHPANPCFMPDGGSCFNRGIMVGNSFHGIRGCQDVPCKNEDDEECTTKDTDFDCVICCSDGGCNVGEIKGGAGRAGAWLPLLLLLPLAALAL